MGVGRRFTTRQTNVFRFIIDTTKINVGATDGSQLDAQFIMPFNVQTAFANTIMRVSDGRSDVVLTTANKNSHKTLTFTTSGIYTIELIGAVYLISFSQSVDKRKIVEIPEFGYSTTFHTGAFNGCVNLIVSSQTIPNLSASQNQLFAGIKGFAPEVNLSTWDFSRASGGAYMFQNVQNSMNSIPQGFINMTNLDRLYQGAPISSVTKIEIISDVVTTAQWMLFLSGFTGQLIMKTPNLTNITAITYGLNISLGQVDIRKVTTTNNFIISAMSTDNVDATLLGWVNNFDWTGVTVTATYDFKNSKYSNNAAVIAAKAFLESKGLVFTNLTMA